MKKLLALTLAVVLALSMGVMAFAANDDKEVTNVSFGSGNTGDTFTGIAVPDKNSKISIELLKDADATKDTVYKGLKDDYDTAVADKKTNTGSVHSDNEPTTCALCEAVTDAEDALIAAGYDLNGRFLIMDAQTAWKAYDTDKSFKLSFKATKGAEYIKSWEIKKTTDNDMYVQVNYNNFYLGGMKDLAFELTLTITNSAKFNAKLLPAANKAPYKTEFARSEYVKFEKNNLKYGFNGTSNSYKDFEIKADSPTDYDVPANLDSSNGTTEKGEYIHFKKGTGETYSFDYGNGNAYFEVKMDNQAVINLYMSTAAIKALVSAYPEADMLFWDWRGKPELDFTATVELYYDEDDVSDEPYLYKWDGSNLTLVNATFEDETATFKTRSLGAYVISSVELDADVVAPSTTAGAPAEATEGTTAVTTTPNPNTGASDFVGVAVALAVVSLAAAGAVALKK